MALYVDDIVIRTWGSIENDKKLLEKYFQDIRGLQTKV